MRRLPLALLLTGCGALAPTGTQRDAIFGGEASPDDTVFSLQIDAGGALTRCSATRLSQRTLLTAAHCVDPEYQGSSALEISATNAPDDGAADAGHVEVSEVRLHPDWHPALGLSHDLALLRLAAPVEGAVAVVNRTSLEDETGALLRVVGYGTDSPDGGGGQRRSVTLPLRQLSAGLLLLGDGQARGICHGDSGGPSFRLSDGQLVGVHSFTASEACTDGADTRVDLELPFIDLWLADTEAECGADGLCSAAGCDDPDCTPTGAPCSSAATCASRLCAEGICTHACTGDPGCEPGLRCQASRCQLDPRPPVALGDACDAETRCVTGQCLTPTGASARCARACDTDADCPEGACEATAEGPHACVGAPIHLPAIGEGWPAAPTGCATAPGAALVLLLVLLGTRPRRPDCFALLQAARRTAHRRAVKHCVTVDRQRTNGARARS